MTNQPSRRAVLITGAAATAGAGAALLAGCGSGSGDEKPASARPTAASTTPAATKSPTNRPLAVLADIPVGGAVAAAGSDGAALIIAQPTAGTVAAFSARCTHRGCTVAPKDKRLECPCHGSAFAAATGKVITGPAPRPLAKVDVHVAAGQVLPGPA